MSNGRRFAKQLIWTDLYCQRLKKVQQAMGTNRPELVNTKSIIYHRYYSARPYLDGWKTLSELV